MKIACAYQRGLVGFLICVFLIGLAGFSSCSQPASVSPPGQTQTPAPASVPASPPPAAPPQASPSVAWTPDGVITAGEYSGSKTYGDYAIHWRVDDQYICVGMAAKTSGWVSVALQPGSGMKGADMILGFVKDAKAEVQDLYCTDNMGTHPADTALGGTDDILSAGGRETGGITTIEFKRSLATSDKYDLPFKKVVNKIMWAYGSSDNSASKHINRGYGEIDLQ